jgi:hypothetical protein
LATIRGRVADKPKPQPEVHSIVQLASSLKTGSLADELSDWD